MYSRSRVVGSYAASKHSQWYARAKAWKQLSELSKKVKQVLNENQKKST